MPSSKDKDVVKKYFAFGSAPTEEEKDEESLAEEIDSLSPRDLSDTQVEKRVKKRSSKEIRDEAEERVNGISSVEHLNVTLINALELLLASSEPKENYHSAYAASARFLLHSFLAAGYNPTATPQELVRESHRMMIEQSHEETVESINVLKKKAKQLKAASEKSTAKKEDK